MVSLGMRRLPMTRIVSMVFDPCANAVPAVTSSASDTPNTWAMRAKRPGIRETRETGVCLIFTEPEPCVEHKYWCGPKFAIWFGFTGRISTPSLLIKSDPAHGKIDYIGPRRLRPNQWAVERPGNRVFPEFPAARIAFGLGPIPQSTGRGWVDA